MRPKRKESNAEKSLIDIQADHEFFLQAFEKPTQIYRYLKTRSLISPIFLHRTLSYMKNRMSRTHKNRRNFKVDSLYEKLRQKSDSENCDSKASLNIVFKGFFDKKYNSQPSEFAKVETIIEKICHKKRKESSSPLTQVLIATQEIPINPPDDSSSKDQKSVQSKVNVTIPTSHFHATNGHHVKSYLLVFRVAVPSQESNLYGGEDPPSKRRKINRITAFESLPNGNHTESNSSQNVHLKSGVKKESILMNGHINEKDEVDKNIIEPLLIFGAELVVYDRYSRCQLCPGEYELVACTIPDANANKLLPNLQLSGLNSTTATSSPKKNLVWESFDNTTMDISTEPFKALENSPIIKFDLTWSSDQQISSPKRKLCRPRQPLGLAMENNMATKPKTQGVTSPESPQLVLYQFTYNNNTRQQTEARYDFHCPWCSLKCLTLYSLLKHLKLCHARFIFTYVPHPKGARIDVSLNDCYDGSYAGNPHDLLAMARNAVCDSFECGKSGSYLRSGPNRRIPTTALLVYLPKRPLKPSLSEFLEHDETDYDLPRAYILGHNRLYHHTISCLPVQPHEIDDDSEDTVLKQLYTQIGEHDSEWVRTKSRMMIDEFTDVNDGEKELIKMWNTHVIKYNFVGDCQVPLACYMFIENHGREILEKNLYRNFLLHLFSLNEFGLIEPGVFYKSAHLMQTRFSEKMSSAFKKTCETQIKGWEQKPLLSPKKLTAFFSPNTAKKTLPRSPAFNSGVPHSSKLGFNSVGNPLLPSSKYGGCSNKEAKIQLTKLSNSTSGK